MADIVYTVTQNDPSTIAGFEKLSQADLNLLQQFEVNNLFDSTKHYIELYITDLTGDIIETDKSYSSYKLLGTAQSAGKQGASVLTIDPIEDSKQYGYESGGVKLLYNFLNDPYTTSTNTTEFYISAISPDRTELQLKHLTLTSEQILQTTPALTQKLNAQSYVSDIRLNFGNNDLLIITNIDTLLQQDTQTVVVKLYEPLPSIYQEKALASIAEVVSDSVAFEVDALFQLDQQQEDFLRPANFNIDLTDSTTVPTQYLNYTDLFSYPVNNSNNQVYSLISEKGAQLSIDHNDYANFIHFSSAYERLVNFKYKVQLIENYSSSLANIKTTTTSSQGTTGSINYFENLITGVVSNFDHYERFLYYESSSYAWPKSNTTAPYINISSSNNTAINWYANQLAVANAYDLSNGSILTNTIPSYLRDDTSNNNYIMFVHMIGQHFDNLWIYAKAVTDKYDNDNRLTAGIAKDLVADALRNFGVKLYTSNKSTQELFGSFIGQGYQSGSEDINTYVTASVTQSTTPVEEYSFDDYNKQVYKRIYHNLPLLLKSKGTERGLRALINCFGIPSDILDIKTYGGRKVTTTPFYGDYQHYTSSLDKIRLDNTGSITSGSTLSGYTSIIKREYKYTDDLHTIEVGFSPTDNIDKFILDSGSIAISASIAAINVSRASGSIAQQVAAYSASINQIVTDYSTRVLADGGSIEDLENLSDIVWGLAIPAPTFTSNATPLVYEFTTIDEFLGNPQNLYESDYSGLSTVVDYITRDLDAYNVQDYVRLIKFFDNTVFKMVKDFIPARAVADTGVIIKPHLLQRSKAKSPLLQGTRPEYSGSIDTAFVQGTDGGMYNTSGRVYRTAYTASVQTPLGEGEVSYINEQAKYNGELSSSRILITTGELNSANAYKAQVLSTNPFNVYRWANADNLCIIQPAGVQYIQQSGSYPANYFFSGVGSTYEYTHSLVGGATTQPFTFPLNTDSYENYSRHIISASNTAISACSASTQVQIAICGITSNGNFQSVVSDQLTYNITEWFTIAPTNALSNIQYKLNGSIILDPTNTSFTGIGTTATLSVIDTAIPATCTQNYSISVAQCTLGVRPTIIGNVGIGNVSTIGTWNLNEDVKYTGQQQFTLPLTAQTLGLASIFTGVTAGTTAYQIQLTLGNRNDNFNPLITITPNTQEQTSELLDINGDRIGLRVRYSYVPRPIIGPVAKFIIETSDTDQTSAEYYASQIRLRITAYNPALVNCTVNTLITPATPAPPDLYICADGRVVDKPETCSLVGPDGELIVR